MPAMNEASTAGSLPPLRRLSSGTMSARARYRKLEAPKASRATGTSVASRKNSRVIAAPANAVSAVPKFQASALALLHPPWMQTA